MSEEKCCVVTCDLPLDKAFWDHQYQVQTINWDLGEVSPPIKSYIDKLQNKDIAVLIPGCGNTYEAEYLLEQGFTNITVIDIAPTLVNNLKQKFAGNKNTTVVLGDFFEHDGTYDLILEQTFFCALPPTMRQKYVWKMHQLLSNNGILAGLLFNREFNDSPPFGGNAKEYEQLFRQAFVFNWITVAGNSIASRSNQELFIEFQKNSFSKVNLYYFEGITCSGCMHTVSEKFLTIDGVLNVSMSTNYAEILIISKTEIALKTLQDMVSYDENYKIKKIK